MPSLGRCCPAAIERKRASLQRKDDVCTDAAEAWHGWEILGIQLRVEARRVDVSLEVRPRVAAEATLHILPQAGRVASCRLASKHSEPLMKDD